MLAFWRAPALSLALISPRVFKPRFLFSLSFQSLLLRLYLFSHLLHSGFAAPSLAAGLCNVPSDNFAAFAFAGLGSQLFFLPLHLARRCANSCFLRTSSACIEAKVAWRFASCFAHSNLFWVNTCLFKSLSTLPASLTAGAISSANSLLQPRGFFYHRLTGR